MTTYAQNKKVVVIAWKKSISTSTAVIISILIRYLTLLLIYRNSTGLLPDILWPRIRGFHMCPVYQLLENGLLDGPSGSRPTCPRTSACFLSCPLDSVTPIIQWTQSTQEGSGFDLGAFLFSVCMFSLCLWEFPVGPVGFLLQTFFTEGHI